MSDHLVYDAHLIGTGQWFEKETPAEVDESPTVIETATGIVKDRPSAPPAGA